MLSFNKKSFLTILCFVLLLTPILASAQITLNVDYPVTEGGGGISGDSSLPQVAKYIFNWAIILALIVAAISLMYGGSLYLSAAGRPDVMNQAKKQIFGSALGLFILFGSFLFLKLTNPTLTILRVKKTAVNTGIILLNKEAMQNPDIFGSDFSQTGVEKIKKTLQTLLDSPAGDSNVAHALYLGFSRPDLINFLGKIRAPGGAEYDSSHSPNEYFENFDLGGIYFLPGSNFQVTTFSDKNYLNRNNKPIGDYQWKYPECSLTPCEFVFSDEGKVVPRSIKIAGIGRGVYLYPYGEKPLPGSLATWQGSIDERYFQSSIDDLDYVNFNDKANQIEIRNWEQVYNEFPGGGSEAKWEWKKLSNYLAILHEDRYNEGNLRIFFEKFWGKLSTGEPILFGNIKNPCKPFEGPAGSDETDVQVSCDSKYFDYENRKPALLLNNKPDAYGKVDKPSSVEVFRILDQGQLKAVDARNKKPYCVVKLCTGYNFVNGNCMYYDSVDNNKPFYFPTNLPEENEDKNGNGTVEDSEKFKISKSVASLSIDGPCVVVLFENKIKDEGACIKCDVSNDSTKADCEKCWDKNGPGAKSNVFIGPKLYPELDLFLVGQCGALTNWLNRFGYKNYDPCASAIAIYPIENPRANQ